VWIQALTAAYPPAPTDFPPVRRDEELSGGDDTEASRIACVSDPITEFHGWHYLRHNQRRQEHLASLGLPLSHRTVLEVGAGVGDHTSFFLDRGCEVVTTDGREENLSLLRTRYPDLTTGLLDLDDPDTAAAANVEIVYCYGTIYHLSRPAEAIAFLARHTSDLILVETCVSPNDDESVNLVDEDEQNPSQALHGRGCRPTRSWVKARLAEHFDNVYLTTTQPWHEEFPLDWSFSDPPAMLTRSVFVASRRPIESPVLTTEIPSHQTRH
jgi:Methyltransferase domain